ncbi:TPA: hypothetical protein HA251_04375 [Candidatus Woesearchaeota archaeon]|nr:hypothetical protein [Candidatus Woesearchaeota archaeon]
MSIFSPFTRQEPLYLESTHAKTEFPSILSALVHVAPNRVYESAVFNLGLSGNTSRDFSLHGNVGVAHKFYDNQPVILPPGWRIFTPEQIKIASVQYTVSGGAPRIEGGYWNALNGVAERQGIRMTEDLEKAVFDALAPQLNGLLKQIDDFYKAAEKSVEQEMEQKVSARLKK